MLPFLACFFQIFGIIIFGISIAGIAKTQDRVPRDFFVVILSFIIFMAFISFIQFAYQRNTQSLYDVQAGNVLGHVQAGKSPYRCTTACAVVNQL